MTWRLCSRWFRYRLSRAASERPREIPSYTPCSTAGLIRLHEGAHQGAPEALHDAEKCYLQYNGVPMEGIILYIS